MIVSAGLSPAWQQIVSLEQLTLGEVNRAREVHWCASGKVANVGIALHHLGAEVAMLTTLGGANGMAARRELELLGVPLEVVETAASTRVCTTLLDRTTGQTTELVESAGAITESELDSFVQAYERLVDNASLVVLTGSLAAGAPTTLFRNLLAKTKVPAVLDVRREELLAALEHRPLVVKPNREELGQTFGKRLERDDDVQCAAHDLIQRGAQWVVVTNGSGPVLVYSQDEHFRCTPPTVKVVNPIGSGDCFAAALAWSLDSDAEMQTAVRRAVAAASLSAADLLPARLDSAEVIRLADEVASA